MSETPSLDSIRIRLAVPGDNIAITEAHRQSSATAYVNEPLMPAEVLKAHLYGPDFEKRKHEEWRIAAEEQTPTQRLIVAETMSSIARQEDQEPESRIIGFGRMIVGPDLSFVQIPEDTNYLEALYVEDAWQGLGAGTMVLNGLLEALDPEGKRSTCLMVTAWAKAVKFYQEMGFHVVDWNIPQQPQIQGYELTQVPMERSPAPPNAILAG